MSGERDLGSYVADMIEACERTVVFAQGISDVELTDESRPQCAAVLHDLMILGEAAKQVPDEWKQRYDEIPWKRIAGMRDKIAHYYFGLNIGAVLLTVRTSVPAILPQLRAMLEAMDAEESRRMPSPGSCPSLLEEGFSAEFVDDLRPVSGRCRSDCHER
jgi:uncharacterized protein with HEPN domain